MSLVSLGEQPEPAWGLQFRLEQAQLDKLGISDPELGDEIRMTIVCCVTSVNEQTLQDGSEDCCVGLQIEQASVVSAPADSDAASEYAAPTARKIPSLLGGYGPAAKPGPSMGGDWGKYVKAKGGFTKPASSMGGGNA